MITRYIVLMALLGTCACGGISSAARETDAPASISIGQLYSYLSSVSAAERASAAKASSALSISGYYKALLASTSDETFVIDGVKISGLKTRLTANRSMFDLLSTQYSSVGAYWTASNFNPLATFTEAQLRSAVTAATAAKKPSPNGKKQLGIALTSDDKQDKSELEKLAANPPAVGDSTVSINPLNRGDSAASAWRAKLDQMLASGNGVSGMRFGDEWGPFDKKVQPPKGTTDCTSDSGALLFRRNYDVVAADGTKTSYTMRPYDHSADEVVCKLDSDGKVISVEDSYE